MSKLCKTRGCGKPALELGYCRYCLQGFGVRSKKTLQHDREEHRARPRKTLHHDSSVWSEPVPPRKLEVVRNARPIKGWFRLGLVVSVVWAVITWFVLEPINNRGYVRDEEMMVVFGPLAIVLFLPALRLTLGLFTFVKDWVADGFRDGKENNVAEAPVLNSGTRLEQVRTILDIDCAYDLTPAGELIVNVHEESYGPWEIASNIVVLSVAMERKQEGDLKTLNDISRLTCLVPLMERLRKRVDANLMNKQDFSNDHNALMVMLASKTPEEYEKADKMMDKVLRGHPYWDAEGNYLNAPLAVSRVSHQMNFDEDTETAF